MPKGFTYRVAPKLVRENPGMTSLELAGLALATGRSFSNAVKSDPRRSLAASLDKEVREGRHKEIRQEVIHGVRRNYPVSGVPSTNGGTPGNGVPDAEETISIRLPKPHIDLADSLVVIGQFKTRSEALAWLIAGGVLYRKPHLEKVRQALEQIQSIKKSLEL